MATIALYAGKVRQMSGLIKDAKRSVGDYRSELSALRTKTLSINKSVCDLDDVIDSIQASSKTQEQKITSLETFHQNSEDFIEDVARIDGNVAEFVHKRKNDFYDKYNYLKPNCEKSGWEKFCDGCKAVGEWCKEHWVEILVGLACIVVGALLTFLTGGAFLPALLAGLKVAAIAGLISGGISGVISVISSIKDGKSFGEIFSKALGSFGDGFASGFMFGGIFACGSQVVSAIFKATAQLGITGTSIGKFKFWSPNHSANPGSGGTLLKYGKTFRLDFEAGRQLFHTHITKNLFISLPKSMQNLKWLFDPAKRDVHVRLTELLGGIWGAIHKKK